MMRRFVLMVALGLAAPVMASDITIGPLDPGVTLTANGASVSEGTILSFTDGDTVTFVTTFSGQTYEDVIECQYDIEVAVHAQEYVSAGAIYLDTDLDYTPYDIFIITSADDTGTFTINMTTPPADDAVKIVGLHLMVPYARIETLGLDTHIGTPSYLAEVFYGTVENDGYLDVATTSSSLMGSSFNKIVGRDVGFSSHGDDDQDVMIQELYADFVETDDSEITWWRMELADRFYCDDYDGYSLNDELPELESLTDDGMLWFKARNPAKWQLGPMTSAYSWDFDNGDYEDYNFWEMHLGGTFFWYNDSSDYEYAHLLGPVTEMDSFTWFYYYDNLYVNFFGDDDSNYYDNDRFDGDYGSAGSDFWNPLLTAAEPAGYGYTAGSIISPVAVFKLRDGDFYTEDNYDGYDTGLCLADDQDLLILADCAHLDFYFDYGVFFEEGTNSHWVVEDGLRYYNDTPTDDAFNITIVSFDVATNGTVSVVATNDYSSTGDDTVSTMYLAYRLKTAYGRQLVKAPMTYDGGTGEWSAAADLEPGEYYFYTVATENDDVYGKVVEHAVTVAEPPPSNGGGDDGGCGSSVAVAGLALFLTLAVRRRTR